MVAAQRLRRHPLNHIADMSPPARRKLLWALKIRLGASVPPY